MTSLFHKMVLTATFSYIQLSVANRSPHWMDFCDILYLEMFRNSVENMQVSFNPLTPELNPSAQRCLPRFLLGILIFKGLTVQRLYKSFRVKGLTLARILSTLHEHLCKLVKTNSLNCS
jgi:hypothetical protein